MATDRLQIRLDAVDNTKRAFNSLKGSVASAKASLLSLKSALLAVGAGFVLKGIIDAGIQIENLSVQLNALFGSAQAGRKALDEVKRFAETTPFELQNIQMGVASLATVSKAAEEAGVSFEELLLITGNTAVQLGGDFALASQQVQRAFSAGIASSELFRERGVTAMAGFETGVSYSIDKSIKGLQKAFGRGGVFGQLIDNLSKTLSGTVSNLRDALFKFQESIASGFFFELKRELGDLKQFTSDNEEAIRKFGVEIGQNFATAIVTASKAIKEFVKNFRDLQAIIGLVAVVLGGFLTKLVGLGLIIDDFKRRAKDLVNLGKDINNEYQKIDMNAVFGDLPQTAIDNTTKKLSVLEQALIKIKEAFDNVFGANQKELIKTFGKAVEDAFKGIKKGIGDAIAQMVVFGKSFKETLKGVLRQVLANFISQLVQIGIQILINTHLAKQFSNAIKGIMGGGKGAGFDFGSILNAGKSLLGFAEGGNIRKGQAAIVGERGRELFIPSTNGTIVPNEQMGIGGTNINFTIVANDTRDFDRLLIERRSTITNLINQALNQQGKVALV